VFDPEDNAKRTLLRSGSEQRPRTLLRISASLLARSSKSGPLLHWLPLRWLPSHRPIWGTARQRGPPRIVTGQSTSGATAEKAFALGALNLPWKRQHTRVCRAGSGRWLEPFCYSFWIGSAGGMARGHPRCVRSESLSARFRDRS